MKTDMQEFSWLDMDLLHRKVAEQIRRDDFLPDIVIGVVRCGLVSATHLAYLLGVRMVGSIYVRTTPSDEILVEKNCEPEVALLTSTSYIIDKKILLVDTVMASGTSVNMSLQLIGECKPKQIKTAIIVDWPTSPYKNKSGNRPNVDYIGCSATVWPDFPWEH